MLTKAAPLHLALAALSIGAAGLTVAQLQIVTTTPFSVETLVAALAGEGLAIVNSASNNSTKIVLADPRQAALFWSESKGSNDIDLGSLGIVLSSAFARNAQYGSKKKHKKRKGYTGDDLRGAGSADLDKLLASRPQGDHVEGPIITQDACVLHFAFLCQPNKASRETNYNVAFDFVFGSDSYPSNGNQVNEDIMGAFLNGENMAVLDNKRTPLSVNTLYEGPLFRDNSGSSYQTSMRGFTAPLTARGTAKAGQVQELVLAVADGGRQVKGRWTWGALLFIRGGSLKCVAAREAGISPLGDPVTSPPPTSSPLVSLKPTTSAPINVMPTASPLATVSPMAPATATAIPSTQAPRKFPSFPPSPVRPTLTPATRTPTRLPTLNPATILPSQMNVLPTIQPVRPPSPPFCMRTPESTCAKRVKKKCGCLKTASTALRRWRKCFNTSILQECQSCRRDGYQSKVKSILTKPPHSCKV
jgi:hypothetical protein